MITEEPTTPGITNQMTIEMQLSVARVPQLSEL